MDQMSDIGIYYENTYHLLNKYSFVVLEFIIWSELNWTKILVSFVQLPFEKQTCEFWLEVCIHNDTVPKIAIQFYIQLWLVYE